MDVKCPGCFAITTVFSHAQSVVLCGSCAQVLSQPTGGKARLAVGMYFTYIFFRILTLQAARSVARRKVDSMHSKQGGEEPPSAFEPCIL